MSNNINPRAGFSPRADLPTLGINQYIIKFLIKIFLYIQICLGGKIPKEMYVTNTEKDKETFTTVTIKKGGKLELDMPAHQLGSLLRYEEIYKPITM